MTTLREVLAREPRPNSEGWVVWLDARTAVKIKQTDYLELHRMVSNMTPLNIWRLLSEGVTGESILGDLPDEFHAEARKLIDDLEFEATNLYDQFLSEWNAIDDEYSVSEMTRGELAQVIQKRPEGMRPALWLLYDQKPLDDLIWKRIRPRGDSQ